jgi:hypothetical protein
MAKTAEAGGSVHGATLLIVNNDVPSDPVAMAAARREQVQRNVDAARAKVAKAQVHLEGTTDPDKQERQLSHLVAAELALASALAEQEGLD